MTAEETIKSLEQQLNRMADDNDRLWDTNRALAAENQCLRETLSDIEEYTLLMKTRIAQVDALVANKAGKD
jgi:regulator of replication initiation timing